MMRCPHCHESVSAEARGDISAHGSGFCNAKTCPRCKERKYFDEFYVRSGGGALSSWCKGCSRDYASGKWRAAHGHPADGRGAA